MKKLLKKDMIHKTSAGWITVYVFMTLLVGFIALPLIYMVSTSFKPIEEIFIYPPRFFVRNPTVNNFIDLLTALSGSTVPFLRYVVNSVFISVTVVVLTVVISSMAAYSLSKHKPSGTKIIFIIIVAALMFSPHVTRVPSYMVVNKLNLINTYGALIFPALATAYNAFLMKQFMDQFPNELLESARMDGAGENITFWKIVMPNLKPAWSTLIVFTFVLVWNDYFSALIYTTSDAMKPMPYALATLGAGSIARAGAVAAATFVMTMPTIIIFIILQKRVMQTMVHSGIK